MDNLNVEVVKRMESFAKEAVKLFPEKLEYNFQEMIRNGIVTADEAKLLGEYVCWYRLMTDRRYYKAVQNAVGEMLLITFKQEKCK